MVKRLQVTIRPLSLAVRGGLALFPSLGCSRTSCLKRVGSRVMLKARILGLAQPRKCLLPPATYVPVMPGPKLTSCS